MGAVTCMGTLQIFQCMTSIHAHSCLNSGAVTCMGALQAFQCMTSVCAHDGRNPIQGVSADIGGSWLALTRTTNNQWAYYNSQGPYSFPMAIRIYCIRGAVLQDTMQMRR